MIFYLLSRHDGALIDLGGTQTTINHTTLSTLMQVYETSRKGYAMQGIISNSVKDIQPPVYTFPIYRTRNVHVVGGKIQYFDYPHPVNTQVKVKYPHRMHIAIYPDRIKIKITGRKPSWWNKAKNAILFSYEVSITTFDLFVEACKNSQLYRNPYH